MDSFESILVALFNIIVLNLILSGDNAVVIGMAVHKLPHRYRRTAVIAGGGLALFLRVILTSVASLLLQIPLLQALGGMVLIWITYHLLVQDEEEAADKLGDGGGVSDAIRTIVIADITMSTDNVLAVGAAAHGSVWLLLFGLTVSMAVVVFGGTMVSMLMNKISWLNYVGAGVLIILAGEMIAEDKWLLDNAILPHDLWVQWFLTALGTLIVVGALYWRSRRVRRPAAEVEARTMGD